MLKTLYPTWKQIAAMAGQFLLAPEKLALRERFGTTPEIMKQQIPFPEVVVTYIFKYYIRASNKNLNLSLTLALFKAGN